jgi:UPF0716 protein FxsA
MRILFSLFIIIPIVEMVLLIKVGNLIGVFPTIGLVMLTAVIGVGLLRQQGFDTLARLQSRLANGEMPGTELLEGAMLLVGGALLLTPGFFTDTVGFVCLIPVFRKPIAQALVHQGILSATGFAAGNYSQFSTHQTYEDPHHDPGFDRTKATQTIEGEFKKEE